MGRLNGLYADRRNSTNEIYSLCIRADYRHAAFDRESIDLVDAWVTLNKKEYYEGKVRKEYFYKKQTCLFRL